jgi:hypothetical protein
VIRDGRFTEWRRVLDGEVLDPHAIEEAPARSASASAA